jgi:hypothetical protein
VTEVSPPPWEPEKTNHPSLERESSTG